MLKRPKIEEDVSLEEHVLTVQSGDEETRHHLLKDYQPFIATCVSKVCKRYINPEKDDEFSIGLLAFNEAIDAYSTKKGSTFLSFARLVITRKVIDYIRSEHKDVMFVSLDQNDEDEKGQSFSNWQLSNAAKENFRENELAWYRQVEIEEFNQKLKEYKLSFTELARVSPKHQDAKKTSQEIAHMIFNHEEIKDYILNKKRLPIKKILPLVDVSKKTIERNRKYILAVFILLNEDFIYLKDYIKGV
ncbi:RNA polymerase sigma-I factor [Tenuibacillus multivorans]|uniref:RNA polymerase sigma factor SigI n=1 Tax=Tenuibacillus multivorans TaxID=237069 RepID=A0A1H0EVW7_9BACI|nr:RNA polymerase sigma-I factor [Tenuibacillus multivorans]GEL76934.1 RNA polymerase sigma factor SigI [Tenuibacillus multivorans]SDN86577.1 RNA polymerase sigma factor [Tenuibacillus multivorans]